MIDRSVSCSDCDAVCCRLTVTLDASDGIAAHLTARTDHGCLVMAKGEDGWCVALDAVHMRCSIYERRPAVCRKFAMGGPYCRDERDRYRSGEYGAIPLHLT